MKIVGPPERPVLNKWASKPKATVPAPSLSSALVVSDNGDCEKLAVGSLGYLHSVASEVQHAQQSTALFNAAFSASHGWSITPDNFKKSMAIFAVRKAVKKTWMNDYDQFTVPDHSLGKLC